MHAVVLAFHLLALLALLLPLNLSPAWRLAVALAVLASALRYGWIPGRGGTGRGVREIQWRGPGQWYLVEGGGPPRPATLCADSLVTAWLVILRLRLADGGRRVVILCRAACPPGAFRRLRVALRYGAFTAESEASSAPW